MIPPDARGKNAFVESPVSVALAAGTVSVAVPFHLSESRFTSPRITRAGWLTLATEVETSKPEVAVTLVVGVGMLRHLQADEMAVATLYADDTAGFAMARFAKTGAAAVQIGSSNLRGYQRWLIQMLTGLFNVHCGCRGGGYSLSADNLSCNRNAATKESVQCTTQERKGARV